MLGYHNLAIISGREVSSKVLLSNTADRKEKLICLKQNKLGPYKVKKPILS